MGRGYNAGSPTDEGGVGVQALEDGEKVGGKVMWLRASWVW